MQPIDRVRRPDAFPLPQTTSESSPPVHAIGETVRTPRRRGSRHHRSRKVADPAEMRRRAQRRTEALNECDRPTVSTPDPVEPPRPSTTIGKKRSSVFRSDHRRSSRSSNGSEAAWTPRCPLSAELRTRIGIGPRVRLAGFPNDVLVVPGTGLEPARPKDGGS